MGSHLNGQRERAMGYNLDGLGAKEPVTGAVGTTNRVVTSSIDAISEVKAYATGMPAEFGHTAGGGLAVVFRSGTNQFHGSLEDRYLNNTLLHRDYFDTILPPPETYHELSAVFSGPVRIPKIYNGKDKTFWLFGYARHHEKASETFIGDVPSPDMLNGNFNFFDACRQADRQHDLRSDHDPPACQRNLDSDPFPGNIIPKNRFDTVANNFLSHNPFTPANTTPGFVDKLGPHQNLVAPTKYRSYRTRFDIKIDHQFNSNHKIFARYSQAHHTSFRDRWVNEANWRLIDPNAIPFPIDQPNIVVSDTYTISPTLINEFRVGFNRRKTTQDPGRLERRLGAAAGHPRRQRRELPVFSFVARRYRRAQLLPHGPGRHLFGSLGRRARAGESDQGLGQAHRQGRLRNSADAIQRARRSAAFRQVFHERHRVAVRHRGHHRQRFRRSAARLRGAGAVHAGAGHLAAALVEPCRLSAGRFQADAEPHHQLRRALVLRIAVHDQVRAAIAIRSHGEGSDHGPARRHRASARDRCSRSYWKNFQPRVGVAWNFRPKLVFRGNFGHHHAGPVHDSARAELRRVPGDGRGAGAGGRSAAGVPPVAGSRAGRFQHRAGWQRAVCRDQLLQPERVLDRSEYPPALHHELVGRIPVGVEE